MTLFRDKNNNKTIVSPDNSDIISSRMHYLHPEYVDEKSKFIYSQNRCPLSMLAETCKNIGKPVIENANYQSQEPSVPISPSCSSSCSAPKFSPHSFEYSPVDQSKPMDDPIKDKSSKDKPKKRKSQKKETEVPLKRPPLDPQTLNSNYAISEFLKMSNFSKDSFSKPDPTSNGNPMYNHLINPNGHNQFNHTSSIWKSKPLPNSRMFFPMNYPPPNYHPPPSIPIQNGLYRCLPGNIMHDINQFYGPCQIDKSPCDCIVCHNRKSAMDKNLLKIEPLLFNFFQGLYKERNLNSNMPLLTFLQNSNNSSPASAIKFCMYCGQCIPLLQNLLNHIHTEHVDSVNTNVSPKIESVTNFSSNFNIENLQSKDMNMNDLHTLKNLELLKQLQFMYNSEAQLENCSDKSILMK